jgi:hypothetical protein
MLTVQPDPAGSGDKVMRVMYQAGLYGDNGGAQFYTNIPNLSSGAMLEYDVLFPGGFDFRLGGKLPGLHGGNYMCSGSNVLPNGTNCFSTRLMWRENGAGEVYFYLPLAAQQDAFCRQCTQPAGFSCAAFRGEPHCSWHRGAFTLTRGRWNKVQQFIRINTPGQPNGILQLFINGVLVMQSTEVVYRTSSSLTLSGLFFSTFFGGDSPAYAPMTNQFSFFKDFRLYRYNY